MVRREAGVQCLDVGIAGAEELLRNLRNEDMKPSMTPAMQTAFKHHGDQVTLRTRRIDLIRLRMSAKASKMATQGRPLCAAYNDLDHINALAIALHSLVRKDLAIANGGGHVPFMYQL